MTFLTLLQNYGGPVIVTGSGEIDIAITLMGTGTVIPRSSGTTVDHRRPSLRRPDGRQEPPVGRRTPGTLPNLNGHVMEALAALDGAPEEFQEALRTVMTPLVSALQEQARFNKTTVQRYDSLPAPHGKTHLGGGDNIISYDDPSPLTPFSTGDPGDPHAGASAGPHVHDMSAFLAYLSDADTELRNGYRVLLTYNPQLTDLLQAILFKLKELIAMIQPGARDN